jgi:hypothetical protein
MECRVAAMGGLVAGERVMAGLLQLVESRAGPLGQFVVLDDPEEPLDVVELRAVRPRLVQVHAPDLERQG